jgi:hypothetical protein
MMATHNARHIGQILCVRKLEGAWDPNNGVKEHAASSRERAGIAEHGKGKSG